MTFRLIKNLTQSVINTVQSSAIASVRVLKSSVFDVRVKNFPKTQTIKGTVTVGNQKRLEKNVSIVDKSVNKLKASVDKIKIPEEISIKNFPKPIKPEPFPKSFNVDNFPKEIRVSNTQDFKEIKVKNQPTKELSDISKKVDDLSKVIKKLKLDPKIEVSSPEVNLPEISIPPFPEFPEQFTLGELSSVFVHKDPKEYVPVRLTDGERFYTALEEFTTSVGGGGSSNPFITSDGKPAKAVIDGSGRLVVSFEESYYFVESEESSGTTYIGKQKPSGEWLVNKIVSSTGSDVSSYATITNNPSVTEYEDAWDNRTTITYGTPKEAQI